MSKFILSTNASNRTVGTTQSVTNVSANYALSGLGARQESIRVANIGAVGAYYALANGTVTATTDDVFLPAGSVEFVTIPDNITTPNIGFITAAGSTGLNITSGQEKVSN